MDPSETADIGRHMHLFKPVPASEHAPNSTKTGNYSIYNLKKTATQIIYNWGFRRTIKHKILLFNITLKSQL